MRFTSLVSAAALAAGVAAQIPALPTSLFGLSFSPQCQQTVIGVLTNGSFAQCFPAAPLLPIFTANASLISSLDQFMSQLCYNAPCSNATLQQAAQTIQTGCAADLANDTQLPQGFVQQAFGAYPIVRATLCLKTSDPYTNASYGGALGNAPAPITTSGYNSTGGYFCVTSVLTQLSAYFGVNPTFGYISSIVSGQNTTAIGLAQQIQPNILCNNCLFGAVNTINRYIPSFSNITVAPIFSALGLSAGQAIPAGITLGQVMDSTCAYVPLMVSQNGTLPANVTQAATMMA